MRPHGFIALISAVIISAVLLVLIASGSLIGFYGRSTLLDAEYKARSAALADACVDEALLKLANDSFYGGDEDISVGADWCHIGPVTGTAEKIFKTQAIFQHSFTNLAVTVEMNDLSITSSHETSD